MTDISKYLEEVLAKQASFFDYSKLDLNLQRQYKNDADYILNSDVFQNEINHIIADTLKNTVMSAKDYQQMEHARTYILALEELKERLRVIPDPNKESVVTQPHEAI